MSVTMGSPSVGDTGALERLLEHVDGVMAVQDDIVEALSELRRTAEDRTDLGEVHRAVLDRATQLDRCAADVRRIAKLIGRLSRMQRFTRVGWPEVQAELRSLATDDPERAALRWLDYAEDAAVNGRVDALERLVRDGPLPPGYEELRRRGRVAAVGLRERQYALVEPFLGEGAAPRSRSRHRAGLRRLLARLSIFGGFLDEADRWLAELDGEPAGLALRAATLRMRGTSPERVQQLLDKALACDPTDLDVVCEATRQAILDERFERARDIADAGVAALPSLMDTQHDLVQLVDPPSELWLALARRARAEHLPDVEENALGLAEERARGGPNETRVAAVAADWRAGGADGEERAALLFRAGVLWTQLGDFERGLRRYGEARTCLGEPPDQQLLGKLLLHSADAAIRAANAAGVKGPDEYRRALDRALRGMELPRAVEESPWSWGVEYDARSVLAGFVAEPRTEHLWLAFRAAVRMVALYPLEGRSWADCADAAGALGFTALAARAARRAHQLGGSSWTTAVWLRAVGDYEAALEISANEVDPWFICLTASLHLDLGHPRECARLMARAPVDPAWHWARVVHVESRLLTEEREASIQQARRYLRESRREVERLDTIEQAALVNIGYLHLLAGDVVGAEPLLRRALEAAVPQDQGAPAYLLGLVLASRGSTEEAVPLLMQGLEARDATYLASWRTYERDIALRLGLDGDVLRLLDDVAGAASARVDSDAVLVERALEEGVPPGVVEECRAAARLLGDVSQERWDAAAESLPLLDDGFWGETPLELQVHSMRARRQPSPEAEVVTPDAADLTEALDEDADRPPQLRLSLPAPWFVDHDDPVATHPIFTRVLPALRAEQPALPPVLVSADASLDGEMLVETAPGVVVAAQLHEGFRVCTREAVTALPHRLQDLAMARDDGCWSIPETAFEPEDRLPRLLTRDVQEHALETWARAIQQPVHA